MLQRGNAVLSAPTDADPLWWSALAVSRPRRLIDIGASGSAPTLERGESAKNQCVNF